MNNLQKKNGLFFVNEKDDSREVKKKKCFTQVSNQRLSAENQ